MIFHLVQFFDVPCLLLDNSWFRLQQIHWPEAALKWKMENNVEQRKHIKPQIEKLTSIPGEWESWHSLPWVHKLLIWIMLDWQTGFWPNISQGAFCDVRVTRPEINALMCTHKHGLGHEIAVGLCWIPRGCLRRWPKSEPVTWDEPLCVWSWHLTDSVRPVSHG